MRIKDKKNQNDHDHLKKYWLVVEYADGDTLKNYLKKNFFKLTWEDKYNLAYQLACAVSCLHDERIVHRDLHSGNILIHQGIIKLADFGLSKRIEAATKQQSKLFGIIPYIDPKRFDRRIKSDTLNEKSDVYSVGVLLWEISSAIEITGGLREKVVPGTPEDYVNIYTACWDKEPDYRPTMSKVADRLNSIISKTSTTENVQIINDESEHQQLLLNNSGTINSLHGELSQLIQNFDQIDELNFSEMVQNFCHMNVEESESSNDTIKINKNLGSLDNHSSQSIICEVVESGANKVVESRASKFYSSISRFQKIFTKIKSPNNDYKTVKNKNSNVRSLSSYTRSSVGLKDEWIIELGFKDMKEMFDSAICEITRLIVNILN
ncbi:11052_t:CDS:2 [Funneliformis geosporum]|nr:11052_t:CDS:2 [Funneliformis geosporum]